MNIFSSSSIFVEVMVHSDKVFSFLSCLFSESCDIVCDDVRRIRTQVSTAEDRACVTYSSGVVAIGEHEEQKLHASNAILILSLLVHATYIHLTFLVNLPFVVHRAFDAARSARRQQYNANCRMVTEDFPFRTAIVTSPSSPMCIIITSHSTLTLAKMIFR